MDVTEPEYEAHGALGSGPRFLLFWLLELCIAFLDDWVFFPLLVLVSYEVNVPVEN